MPNTSNRGICKSGYIPADGADIRNKKKRKNKQECSTKAGNITCNMGIEDAEKHRALEEDMHKRDGMTMHTHNDLTDVSVQENMSKESVCMNIRENCYKELFDRQIDKNLRMISRYLKQRTPGTLVYVELYAGISKIHGIGMFAGKDIQEGTRIIEYVGELIGKKVADKREKFYKENGILSVYLFKIFDDLIVDATLKGNPARFINHSCNPNAMARISHGRIFIYSIHKIKEGEEITFYYNFSSDEHDDTRLSCYCGHDICTKFMG